MKIVYEQILNQRIDKEFTIELDNGDEIIVRKWLYDDQTLAIPDGDWEIEGESKEIFNKLSDDERDKVSDFLNDIKL